ncbi:DUF2778 domain-containing protein [Bradyrhizobium sp. dw_78]|uniref:DUF2778 domain-containing protein n=1 Tax=Bradyrhizobium sp. dw_78 TaxID=2719793 RepID=UPI00201CA468|nr:DUF2778 domain-containing protein [Bradyrhizobium sp. dw_78]
MAYIAMTDGRFPSGPSRGSFGKIAPIVATLAIASGATAWIAGFDPGILLSRIGSSVAGEALTFDDRFLPVSKTPPTHLSPRLLVQAWSSELDLKLHQAKSRLAEGLQSQGLQSSQELSQQDPPQQNPAPDVSTAAADDAKPATAPAVPIPRSRPVEASFEAASVSAAGTAVAARPDDRTWLQKLSALLPAGGLKLASLTPESGIGISEGGPDLTTLGYDKVTAVYDISAHVVYMPNGLKLEAHSGMGRLMDDPEHVNERNVGATPPATYDLKPREHIFHGVEALRMIPQDSNATLGRTGLLTHSFMLGPNGDSNGCVSIRNYDRFLAAYKNGEISHLVVVPSLNITAPDTRRADSQT